MKVEGKEFRIDAEGRIYVRTKMGKLFRRSYSWREVAACEISINTHHLSSVDSPYGRHSILGIPGTPY